MKIALFGGSFDPPTLAHYKLTEQLSARFDKVIVLPAYISPFKADGASLSGEVRYDMLSKLFAHLPNVEVSDYELTQKGTSYSYMTAQHFYNETDELFFVIGSDGLPTINKWARLDILSQLVTFYIVERPFYAMEESDLTAAKKLVRLEIAPFTGEEGSSSLLKVATAFNRQREIVPTAVAEYIEKNGLYNDYRYITDRYGEFNLTAKRVEHVYRTTKAAIILAQINGENVRKAIIAALLHDIAKYLDRADFERMNIPYPDNADKLPSTCTHQVTGASIARHCFNITDEDILAAIATHTTGDSNMSLLQKIVFAADYIEDGRDFGGIADIRALTYEDIDLGVIAILKNTVKYLTEKKYQIAEQTLTALDSYIKESNNND